MDKLNAQGPEGPQFNFEAPDFLRCRLPDGREKLFPYKNGLRLSVSPWTGELRVRYGREQVSLAALSLEQLRNFLLEFFRRWNAQSPDTAKKAAFDYVDAQRGFVPVAFVACLLVSLPTSIALLADSHQQFRCTQELREHSVPGLMKVVKARKRDARTFLLNLEFTAPNGQIIRGQEEVLTEKDTAVLPKNFPIAYSPSEPDCWSLTKGPSSTEINWARRRYFAAFALLFGLFFLTVTFVGLAWCMVRWVRPRPYSQEVGAIFGLSQSS